MNMVDQRTPQTSHHGSGDSGSRYSRVWRERGRRRCKKIGVGYAAYYEDLYWREDPEARPSLLGISDTAEKQEAS